MDTEYHYSKLKEMFGDQLPDPQHYPVQFEYYVKLYRYYIQRQGGSLVPVDG